MPTDTPAEITFDTERGPLTVRRRCSVDLIERLTVDEGFGNILKPSRAKDTFKWIASAPEGNVTLAYTTEGLVAGYVLISRPAPSRWQQRVMHDRWEQCEAIHELGSIEVSKNFRSMGIAGQLMDVAMSDPAYREAIVVAQGMSRHWDLASTGGNAFIYRERLLALLNRYGFSEYGTDQPEVRADPANALVARFGPDCAPEHIEHFHGLRNVGKRNLPPDAEEQPAGQHEHFALDAQRGAGMTVGERMTPQPVTAAPGDTLQRVRERMASRKVRHLPVVDGGQLVGVITDRDIRQSMPSPQIINEPDEARSFLTMVKVEEVMIRNVVTVEPGTAIERAARLFLERGIGCLPVVADGQLAGILTQTDMLRALADLLADLEAHHDPESLD